MRKDRKAVLREEQRNGKLRCAVYTRKSTDEGLEKEFNSLDAQREACEAYIVSQRHEGWLLVADSYDDGGFSGGSMERPGLKRLLNDVRTGKVDVILVYKVDRLTRALSDFAKIVDILDAAGASFVSITQAFNTTTSMGRLTLNVLLSFAQFEREVISERVRDKVAASKVKGMWMGGAVALGYDPVDRKLIINQTEATTVRHIFKRYLEVGSIQNLVEDLRTEGIVTKLQYKPDRACRGGIPFLHGSLTYFLKNRLYRGEIRHHDKYYPGEHTAIVDAALFDAVQTMISEHNAGRRSGITFRHPSLLAGMIRDSDDRPMSPERVDKPNAHYAYYASNRALTVAGSGDVMRLPAGKLNLAVVTSLIENLPNLEDIFDIYAMSAGEVADATERQVQLLQVFDRSRISGRRATLLAIDLQVTVFSDRIEASFCRNLFGKLIAPAIEIGQTFSRQRFDVPASLRRRGVELKLRLDPVGDTPSDSDAKLINLIVRAFAAREQLEGPNYSTASRTRRELARVARISFLAPDIILSIFEGRQPSSLRARQLERIGELPICWMAQRSLLGFA